MATANPSPKVRFQSDRKVVENHRSLMQRGDLRMSIDFALLEYQGHLQRQTPENMAGAGHLKIVGALEFVHTLMNLGETTVLPSKTDTDNLKHDA